MRTLLFFLFLLPLQAKEFHCPKGRALVDFKSPVTSKRSVYCILKKGDSFIKDGPEMTYDILGKLESKKFYINGVEAPFPKKEAHEFEIPILNSKSIIDSILSLSFSWDHKRIAVSTTKGKVRVYDLADQNKMTYLNFPSIKNEKGLSVPPQSVAWSKDGNLLAAGFVNGQMVILNTLKNIPHVTFDVEGKASEVTTFLRFTDDGLLINRHGTIHYYDTINWQRLWKTEGDTHIIHIDEKRKLVVMMDPFKFNIVFKSIKNGKSLESYHLSTNLKRKAFFNSISYDGKLISAAEEDLPLSYKENKKVEFATLKNVQTNKGLIADKFVAMSKVTTRISTDKNKYFVIASPTDENYDSELKVYNIKTKKLIYEKLIPLKKWGKFWVSDNSRYFAFEAKDTNLRIIDMKDLLY